MFRVTVCGRTVLVLETYTTAGFRRGQRKNRTQKSGHRTTSTMYNVVREASFLFAGNPIASQHQLAGIKIQRPGDSFTALVPSAIVVPVCKSSPRFDGSGAPPTL